MKYELMCRWVGEKPTSWHPIKWFRSIDQAEYELERARRYATKTHVEVEYHLRESD